MDNKCKNCNHSIQNNYCDMCGQSTKTTHINSHYLIEEIQHSIFHVDKGILYTIKKLTLRPGHTIKEYLSGKRVQYFKPFAYILILGTLYGFVAHFFELYPETEIMAADISLEANQLMSVIFEWVYSHYAICMLILLPITALASFIVFRKAGYNYMEHMVITAYIGGQQVLLFLVIYPLYYIVAIEPVVYTVTLISYVYYIWVFVQIFRTTLFKTIIKSIASLLLGMGFSYIVIFIVSLIAALLYIF